MSNKTKIITKFPAPGFTLSPSFLIKPTTLVGEHYQGWYSQEEAPSLVDGTKFATSVEALQAIGNENLDRQEAKLKKMQSVIEKRRANLAKGVCLPKGKKPA